ncbi:MAG: zf-HC2 domain-containing protein, partial [Lentisphaeria bacterium]|nr:zf-HC2 domain-containing protein [Lentisphaeria bacterium]
MKLCEEYAALLDMYVDGFCTAEETVRVRAHLAECEACRMYVEQILQMKEAFPDAESEEVPDGFAE